MGFYDTNTMLIERIFSPERKIIVSYRLIFDEKEDGLKRRKEFTFDQKEELINFISKEFYSISM